MADFSTDELDKLAGAMAKAFEGKKSRKEKRAALEELSHQEEGNKLHRLENKHIKEILKSSAIQKVKYKELGDDLTSISKKFSELEDSLRAVRSSLRGFGAAAYSGTGSISEFTESLRGSSEILNFVADLGKTFDVNAETFRGLTEVGANFNQSIVEMRRAAASAALPLDDFAKLVRDNSTTLAALYGSTTKGAMAIAGLSEALRTEATPELATLGFTVDEINETLLTNMDRQRRSGIFDRLTTTQRIQSAAQFAKELDRLAKLTGQQRSELRSQLDQQASNARFAAFIRTQDEDTQRRLSGFAATIGAVAPLISEGMQDIIANAGRPVTDAGITLVQNMPEMQTTIQQLIAGLITSEEALMQMRDLSVKSLDRFSKAAVTGQVEFTALTPSIVNLAGLTLDYGKVLDEQGNIIAGGTSALMKFQENAKRLSAATQSLETGFYSMLGSLGEEGPESVVGAIGDMSDKFVKGTTDFTKALLYGTKTLTKMGLNLLRDVLPTYTAVYMGTRAGIMSSGGMGGMGGMLGKGKGVGKFLGKAGVAGLGAIGVSQFGAMAGKEDATGGEKLGGVLGSAASGALIGAMFGGIPGALIGGGLGAAYGGYKALSSGKAFGGPLAGGQTSLVGEQGPEIITSGTASTVTSNAELKKLFNTENLEKKIETMIGLHTASNKIHSSALESLNTSNMINNKTRVATEMSARKDRNQVGIVKVVHLIKKV